MPPRLLPTIAIALVQCASCWIAGTAALRLPGRGPTATPSLLPPPLALSAQRAPSPRASLPIDASLLLAVDDVIGEVFMAGMAIAFATVGTTIFVGILVRAKYDDIEASFFEAQDEERARDSEEYARRGTDQAAKDFFGDSNPTPLAESAAPQSAAQDFFGDIDPTPTRTPADQSSA